jgi:hypothetical protein
VPLGNGGSQGRPSKSSTDVFWAVAVLVFDTRRKKSANLDKVMKRIGHFLDCVEYILQEDIKRDVRWNRRDNAGRADMTDYLAMHLSSVPRKLITTLREAQKKGIVDLNDMLFWSTGYITSSTAGEDIDTSSKYLDFLDEKAKGDSGLNKQS